MSDRVRSPKEGYDFASKAEYRQRLWRCFADHLGEHVSKCHVAIMPSREGLELPILRELGVKESHIHAIDSSAAMLATAKWRGDFPEVNVYGNELARAMERIVERIGPGKIRVANLDLCGGFTSAMVESITGVFRSGALAHPAFVSITMLKGREHPATIAALRLSAKHNTGRDLRIGSIAAVLENEIDVLSQPIAQGEYRSKTQTMVWEASLYAHRDMLKFEISKRMPCGKKQRELDNLYAERERLRRNFSTNGRYSRIEYDEGLFKAYPPRDTFEWQQRKRGIQEMKVAQARLDFLEVEVERIAAELSNAPERVIPFPISMLGYKHIGEYRSREVQNWANFSPKVLPLSQWELSKYEVVVDDPKQKAAA
jgi:hypothetical protein